MSDTIQYQSEFIKICEVGNIYDAADALYISDSNLIKHMRNLEDEIGHKLFYKYSKKVELTPYGSLYLSFAYRFKALDVELMQKTAEFDAKSSSIVKLALSRTMNCDHIVNMLSDHFCKGNTDYSMVTKEMSRTCSLSQIFSQGYELVFATSKFPNDAEFNTYQWSTDRLVAILPKNHPLANNESIGISQLANDKFILFPEGSFLNRYAIDLCQEAGFTPSVDFTIHGTNNLAELVSAGIGVSLTTSSDIISIKKHDVAMIEIEPTPLVYLNLYSRKDIPLSAPAKAFWDFAIYAHENHNEDIPYQGPEGNIGNVYFK